MSTTTPSTAPAAPTAVADAESPAGRSAVSDAVISATKHHGLGNDFLIVVDPARQLTADDAVRWCDRRRGIGADGLISATPGAEGSWSMVLWNSDGSRPEVSGNGLRCLGQALAMHQGSREPVAFTVATDGGLRTLDVEPGIPEARVRVDMGAATESGSSSSRWSELGVDVQRQVGVEIGNPHLVALVDDASCHDMTVVGPAVEADFAEGINVHLIDVVDRSTIRLFVWERGAGFTEACGSGACAAAWAARSWGLTEPTVDVVMPGGSASVEVVADPEPTVLLTGPAVFVGNVELAAVVVDTEDRS